MGSVNPTTLDVDTEWGISETALDGGEFSTAESLGKRWQFQLRPHMKTGKDHRIQGRIQDLKLGVGAGFDG